MNKTIITILLLINLNNLQAEENIVKTSELELFLFKVGFESLLKDVDTTKNKATLNEEELKKLNSKIKIIMDEIYKNKRVITSDNEVVVSTSSANNEEIKLLRNEIELLKKQMEELTFNKNIKEEKITQKKIENKTQTSRPNKIKVEFANIRDKASMDSNVIDTLSKESEISIESCDKFGWCKFKDEEKYISKYLLY